MSGSSRRSRWPSSNGWTAAAPTPARRSRPAAIARSFGALAIAFAASCAGRTVLIPESDTLLRVGPGGTKTRVWYHLDGEWVDSGAEVRIPEGWYLLPPRFVEDGE